MLDEQERDPALLPQGEHVLQQLCRQRRVHAGRRLVEQDQSRLGHQDAREVEQLALATGERSCVGICLTVEPHERQKPSGLLLRGLLVRADRARRREDPLQPLAAVVRRSDQHVLEHRQLRERPRRLERADEPGACDPVRRAALDRLPEEADRAPLGAEEARDDVEQGRLAGPVRADQRRDRACGDVERRCVDRAQAAEAACHVPHLEQAHSSTISSRFPSSPCGRNAISPIRIAPIRASRTYARSAESK